MVKLDHRFRHFREIALALLGGATLVGTALAQGIYISSSGPLNRGMGGASTAAPLDALGATYWNPAAITGLESSELAFGIDMVASNHRVLSAVGPFSGTSEADNGVFPVPSVAWVHRTSTPGVVLGFAVNGVAGLKTNLPSNPANPVLAPAPAGLGRVSSEASFLQFAPMVSLGVSQSLSVGIGPVVTMGQVSAEPFVFAAPNTDARYSPARAARYHWGGGAQIGIYFARRSFRFGASIKSPAWMETFRFYGQDATGGPRLLEWDVDLPTIASLGAAYVSPSQWVFAFDLRYLDYAHADGFGGPARFDGTGALQGLGWRSILATGAGVQAPISGILSARIGYAYNQSPIRSQDSFFNLASPLIYRHTLSAGLSFHPTPRSSVTLAYSYFLPQEVIGPIVSPVAGPIPGSSVQNRLDVHVVSVGVTSRY